MKVQGSEAIIKCLIEEGVDTIYGYPGGAIMPVYDSLYHYKDQIPPWNMKPKPKSAPGRLRFDHLNHFLLRQILS